MSSAPLRSSSSETYCSSAELRPLPREPPRRSSPVASVLGLAVSPRATCPRHPRSHSPRFRRGSPPAQTPVRDRKAASSVRPSHVPLPLPLNRPRPVYDRDREPLPHRPRSRTPGTRPCASRSALTSVAPTRCASVGAAASQKVQPSVSAASSVSCTSRESSPTTVVSALEALPQTTGALDPIETPRNVEHLMHEDDGHNQTHSTLGVLREQLACLIGAGHMAQPLTPTEASSTSSSALTRCLRVRPLHDPAKSHLVGPRISRSISPTARSS